MSDANANSAAVKPQPTQPPAPKTTASRPYGKEAVRAFQQLARAAAVRSDRAPRY